MTYQSVLGAVGEISSALEKYAVCGKWCKGHVHFLFLGHAIDDVINVSVSITCTILIFFALGLLPHIIRHRVFSTLLGEGIGCFDSPSTHMYS